MPPVSTALLDALRNATPAEIVNALHTVSSERNGLAYDVGLSLIETNACKEFPGPPWGWRPAVWNGLADLYIKEADPARMREALRTLREVTRWDIRSAHEALLVASSKGNPVRILEGVPPEEARAAKTRLEDVGVRVDLDTNDGEAPTSHVCSLKELFSSGPRG
jgi:hypothetical protein